MPAGEETKKAALVDPLPKEDPEKKEEALAAPPKLRQDKDEPDSSDLTPEDLELKTNLELLVTRITEKDNSDELRQAALDAMGKEIRSSTSSMTSVPKPLKFLRPHYDTLKTFYAKLGETPFKRNFADVLSVLAMTMQKEGSRECLAFKLGSGSILGTWGHEYVRHLAGEISEEYHKREEDKKDSSDLQKLVDEIVPFHMTHNAESDACDLLIEVDRLEEISKHVTKDNFTRVAIYLRGCADYFADDEDKAKCNNIVFSIFLDHKDVPQALVSAMRLKDKARMQQCFNAAKEDEMLKKQLGFILGVNRVVLSEIFDDNENWGDDLRRIVGNDELSAHFVNLARDLDVQEGKTPEDIYKSHLEGGGVVRGGRAAAAAPTKVDSAKQNLAATFVNAFVNCGFGKDKLMTVENSEWLYKNKEHGMLSAAASLGMIYLWDLETGFSNIDKYSFSQQKFIKAGALLASGMISCGVTSEMDASLALLTEHVESADPNMKLAAIYGLGLSYAGTARDDITELLVPVVADSSQPLETVAMACLSLGLTFVGTANDEIATTIVELLTERESELKDSVSRLISLALGLLYLGNPDSIETISVAIQVVPEPMKQYTALVLRACAYFGTGNVLEIQKLLSVCGEHPEDENEENTMHQAVAVLGLAMIVMGEDLGSNMILRSFDHVLQYGDVTVRRAVPLALALLSISHAHLTIMDTLSKLSHDQDEQISQNAIMALGFIGAGTNNSRIANLLRQLAVYYQKEPNHLFVVRIAQGLLHMGKGLLTLSPLSCDNLVLSPMSAAGILTVLFATLDAKNTILSKRHYLLYSLVTAVRPRLLVTLDENMKSIPVKVRVGQAVDTVAQAGKPKAISGFQTHTTPVLLSHGERAELATDEYIPYTSILEGFVIVRKNPDATKEED